MDLVYYERYLFENENLKNVGFNLLFIAIERLQA